MQDVVADVRRLVHDLRPPALDDRGLVGALTQLAEQSPVPVEVVAEDLGPLPAAVEVAAYRIAGEALTNVQRHARASRCTIALRRSTRPTGAELLVEVADDGVGVPAEVEAGRRPGQPARAGRRARRPQRGRLPAVGRHPGPRPPTPEEQP